MIPSSSRAPSPPPKPISSLPPSSNPFAIFSEADSGPENLPSEPPFLPSEPPSSPLILQSTLDPPPLRITNSLSKEHEAPSDANKRQGPGRKTTKQHREENAQKDIALGTQSPIETFILGHLDKENNRKGQERRAPLHVTSKS